MRNNVQLYINNQLVDLFDFEDINIVDSIQDVRDISKVFVPFSRQFTVPASKNNNKIFKHYYNYDIVGGFDARFKISAILKINGVVYKKGKVVLNGATLKNDKPLNYKLVFYGNTIDLKEAIGDKMLSDINSTYLDKFTFEYTPINAYLGFSKGFKLVSDVLDYTTTIDDKNNPKDLIFPFISSNNHYYYDADENSVSPSISGVTSRNLNSVAPTDTSVNPDLIYGISYRDLRGAIRLPILIDAIEEAYGITFTGDFFSETNEEFNRLYLYLQKERGLYESHAKSIFSLSDLTLSGTDQEPMSSYFTYAQYSYYSIIITTTTTESDDDYNLKVVDKISKETLFESDGKGGTTFNFDIKPTPINNSPSYDLEFSISDYTSATVGFSITIKKFTKALVFQTLVSEGTYTGSVSGTTKSYYVKDNFPKMKVIDFLMGLFKMFNLTAYADLDGNIAVETLDEYYNAGNTTDISKYTDSSNVEVTKNKLYSEISFEFEKASTFAVLNSNEYTNDEFGNERMQDVNEDGVLNTLLAFDGGKYSLKTGFEKVQYERMTDQSAPNAQTDISWGWLVDKDEKPVLSKPLLLYAENVTMTFPINMAYDKEDGTFAYPSQYYRPSNSITDVVSNKQSLHFGSEFNEHYTGLGNNEASLFNRYWKNYILSIYDEKSRIISVEAYLPASLITTIQLNHVLVINNKKYRINKLDISITTGKAKLELITYREILPFYNDAYRIDVDTITIDSDLITIDTI